MAFHKLNDGDLKYLASLVSSDRSSTGASNLDLHARDMSRHRPSRPEIVIWPVDRSEVCDILKFAFEKEIPVTPWGAGTSLEGNPIPVEGGIYDAPAVQDGLIYFSTDTSSLVVVNQEGVVQRNQPVDGKLYAGPVAEGDKLLLAPNESEYYLIALNQNGVQAWGYPPAE